MNQKTKSLLSILLYFSSFIDAKGKIYGGQDQHYGIKTVGTQCIFPPIFIESEIKKNHFIECEKNLKGSASVAVSEKKGFKLFADVSIDLSILKIKEDSHSFLRALSQIIYNSQDYHMKVRLDLLRRFVDLHQIYPAESIDEIYSILNNFQITASTQVPKSNIVDITNQYLKDLILDVCKRPINVLSDQKLTSYENEATKDKSPIYLLKIKDYYHVIQDSENLKFVAEALSNIPKVVPKQVNIEAPKEPAVPKKMKYAEVEVFDSKVVQEMNDILGKILNLSKGDMEQMKNYFSQISGLKINSKFGEKQFSYSVRRIGERISKLPFEKQQQIISQFLDPLDVQVPESNYFDESIYYPLYEDSFVQGQVAPNHTGIKNQGNTCYFNASIQALNSIYKFMPTAFVDPKNPSLPVVSGLMDIFQTMKNSNYLNPIRYQQTLLREFNRFSKGNIYFDTIHPQQDANEFMERLFGKLEEEYKKSGRLEDYGDKFYGKFSETYTASSGKMVAKVYDNFSTLIVKMNNNTLSIEDGFENEFMHKENMDADYKPDGHIQGTTYSKEIKIFESPKFLRVMLGRFLSNDGFVTADKNLNFLSYPENLDLSRYFDKTSPQKDPISRQYVLQSVIIHSGATNKSGHYWAYTRDLKNNPNAWFEANDRNVKPVTKDDVETIGFGGNNQKTAYVLFYVRRDLV